MKVKIMRPGADTDELIDAYLPDRPSLSQIRAIVEPHLGGGEMEHVNVLHNGQHVDMFVDDMGKLKGLPFNERATAIYRAAWLASHRDDAPETLPAIYGVAVLFPRRVWF